MGDVFARVFAEVAADSPLGGFLGVRRAEELAHLFDCVFAFENREHHGAAFHKLDERRIVRLVNDVRVVHRQNGFVEPYHFAGGDIEPRREESSEDFGHKAFFHTVGFEND